jgi:hypothetical protein
VGELQDWQNTAGEAVWLLTMQFVQPSGQATHAGGLTLGLKY